MTDNKTGIELCPTSLLLLQMLKKNNHSAIVACLIGRMLSHVDTSAEE